MSAALLALPTASLAASVAALLMLALSMRLRPHDARLWHGAWTALALAAIAAPLAALVPPVWEVVVLAGPAAPLSPTAGLSADRLALALNLAAIVALSGSAVFAWRLIAGGLLAMRLARQATPPSAADGARLDRLVSGVAALTRTHPRVRVPVAIGWRRPVIVLPESWRLWPDDRLAAVLRHERAHVTRHDFLWNIVAAVHHAIYWWNPFAWVVARRIRLTAELSCDREAAGDDAVVYAKHLLAAAQELSHSAWTRGVLAPGAGTDLVRRITALTDTPHTGPSTRTPLRLLLILVALAVVLTPMLVQARVSPHQAPAPDHTARHAARHAGHGIR
jgi:beta-lactamase regulating signal transducer with metallopeptidase domain